MTLILALALTVSVLTFFWFVLLITPYIRTCTPLAEKVEHPVNPWTVLASTTLFTPALILTVWLWSLVS